MKLKKIVVLFITMSLMISILAIPTFAASGSWKKNSTGWWYSYSGGGYATGWEKIGGVWYYFNSAGYMKTGWVKSGNTWYFMKSSGAMQTGWKKIGGKWYYMALSGAMQTGWEKIGGKWYYLKPSGAMVTGTQKINGKTEIFASSGVWQRTVKTSSSSSSSQTKVTTTKPTTKVTTTSTVKTVKNGWKKESGKWYYYKNNLKQTGWLKLSGKWYYLDKNGVMVIGKQTIDGKIELFASSGVWQRTVKTSSSNSNTAKKTCTHKWVLNRNNSSPPTCDANGYNGYDCSICGFRKEETIPPTGKHIWVDYTISALQMKNYKHNNSCRYYKDFNKSVMCSICKYYTAQVDGSGVPMNTARYLPEDEVLWYHVKCPECDFQVWDKEVWGKFPDNRLSDTPYFD